MCGYGGNHHKLIKSARDKIPGFFVQRSPALWGVPRRYGGRQGTGAGRQEQGDREQGIFTRFAEIEKKTLQNHV